MKNMTSNEIRDKFLRFFESKGHKIIPSSSLIPTDSSVLFTTAGMQQFKPYYTDSGQAEKDFGTKNVVTVQKCVRTGDIDEVGDNSHLTFFEMLGNFSFGGYGRKEAIEYAYEFINKEMGLKISYVTVYKGEGVVPCDEESKIIWKKIDSNLKIKEEGADVFWGPTGESGPCGPTTEIYCKNAKGEDIEIWNIVFNEYFSNGSREKLDKGQATLAKLPVLGVDTGMGLERLVTIVQNKESVYDTDLFFGEETKEKRIITDHLKASLFIISDGVIPSNNGSGYVLRRLIRRALIRAQKNKIDNLHLGSIMINVREKYSRIYDNIFDDKIIQILNEEIEKFKLTLEHGLKEFEKGVDPFILFTSYGFPIELTTELAKEKGVEINIDDFNKKMEEHQKLSQTSSAGMFKGGLADAGEESRRLHTATHLLNQALREIVDDKVVQKGSNITKERLRFDFSCDHKLTDEEKIKIENWINDKIKKNLKVIRREMPFNEAKNLGAQMEFGAKYPEIVSVYFIEDENGNVVSKEFCGGPHVKETGILGVFKIQKEESVAQGVRRIKAILI